MFSNKDEIVKLNLFNDQFSVLDKECSLFMNQYSGSFNIIDYDVCDSGFSIQYKSYLYVSFN